jgi:hypothetical protein
MALRFKVVPHVALSFTKKEGIIKKIISLVLGPTFVFIHIFFLVLLLFNLFFLLWF